jgi:hypothetical protein
MLMATRSKVPKTSMAKKPQARTTPVKKQTDTAMQPGTPSEAMRAVTQEANMRNLREIIERAQADTAKKRAKKRTR